MSSPGSNLPSGMSDPLRQYLRSDVRRRERCGNTQVPVSAIIRRVRRFGFVSGELGFEGGKQGAALAEEFLSSFGEEQAFSPLTFHQLEQRAKEFIAGQDISLQTRQRFASCLKDQFAECAGNAFLQFLPPQEYECLRDIMKQFEERLSVDDAPLPGQDELVEFLQYLDREGQWRGIEHEEEDEERPEDERLSHLSIFARGAVLDIIAAQEWTRSFIRQILKK